MTETMQTTAEQWPLKRAIILSSAFLLVGLAGGWFIRGWESPQLATTPHSSANPANVPPAPAVPDPARLTQTADTQAAPLLEKLKADPGNPDLLTSLGNLYYDAQQYPTAIDYYGRALERRPEDANVRTDLGTAYWYMGNADAAITEFNKALTYAPTNANTLFNLGLVKWQGKGDPHGALADWDKLLAANPNYEGRDKVQQMIAEVKTQSASALASRSN